MPQKISDKRKHLVLTNTSEAKPFTAPSLGRGSSDTPPSLDRAQHGAKLKKQLQALQPIFSSAAETQRTLDLESGIGLQIQFVGIPDINLAFESLGSELGRKSGNHIEVLSIHTESNTTVANVFVPDGRLSHFEKYLTDYIEEKKNIKGNPIDHSTLFNTISAIRAAELRALWTDDLGKL